MQKDFVENLKKSYEQGFLEGIVEFGGHTYLMRTLNGIESLWRDRYSMLSVSASFLSSRKIPTLAVAIRKIDGKDVTDIFAPDDGDKQDNGTPTFLTAGDIFDTPQLLAAEELRKFLGTLPEKVIDFLFESFNTINNKVEEVKKEVVGQEAQPFRKTDSK